MALVDELIAYEEGQITGDEEIAFFERLARQCIPKLTLLIQDL